MGSSTPLEIIFKALFKADLKDSMRGTYNSSWNKKPQRCHRFRNGLLKLNPVDYNCIDTNNHQQCFPQGVYTSEGQTKGKLVHIGAISQTLQRKPIHFPNLEVCRLSSFQDSGIFKAYVLLLGTTHIDSLTHL